MKVKPSARESSLTSATLFHRNREIEEKAEGAHNCGDENGREQIVKPLLWFFV